MQQTWLDYYKKEGKSERQLVLLYLCNDIVQKSRKQQLGFVEEFEKVLPEALSVIFKAQDAGGKIKPAVVRLLAIWKDRLIFSDDFIQNLSSRLGVSLPTDASAAAAAAASSSSSLSSSKSSTSSSTSTKRPREEPKCSVTPTTAQAAGATGARKSLTGSVLASAAATAASSPSAAAAAAAATQQQQQFPPAVAAHPLVQSLSKLESDLAADATFAERAQASLAAVAALSARASAAAGASSDSGNVGLASEAQRLMAVFIKHKGRLQTAIRRRKQLAEQLRDLATTNERLLNEQSKALKVFFWLPCVLSLLCVPLRCLPSMPSLRSCRVLLSWLCFRLCASHAAGMHARCARTKSTRSRVPRTRMPTVALVMEAADKAATRMTTGMTTGRPTPRPLARNGPVPRHHQHHH